ncbi:hypothetical protein GF1_27620 [Desulfolithobacter dissulfuricans]|uniref:Formylmethanofuran dehydrogenase subunit E domain-containing protein n=2 Tax=Desulfolithobacter dissulfuricans TaxID=2795293 RepID=A0A915UAX0_9BACT|nr:hypothetical protein GF1_27620 [Desulfolithobacter dissulfuricans]
MLIPMELHCLTLRKGYLSPELAIGWQIGKYVEEFFDGLEEVWIAAARDDDAVLALSYLTRQHGHPGQVIVPETARPWDFLFYHLTTGTRLGFTLIRQRTRLPQKIRDLEPDLCVDNPAVVEIYQASLNLLIKSVLCQPVTSFCQVRQARCRRLLSKHSSDQQTSCHRCGRPVPLSQAWDIEGDICCPACTGLEPVWYTLH